jgi:NAD(P)H-dependent FMN reductase
MNKQPLAVQLADEMDFFDKRVSVELRRLHAVNRELLEACRAVMDCAGEINQAPDDLLQMALDDGDEETKKQAKAFLACRAAITKAEAA